MVEVVGSKWKLEVLWSNFHAQKGSPRSSCPGQVLSQKLYHLAGQLHNESVFWCSEGAFFFPILPIDLCPTTGHHWGESDSIFFLTSLLLFMYGIPLQLLFCRLKSPSSLSLFSHKRCFNPFVFSGHSLLSLQSVHGSQWEPRTSGLASPMLSKREATPSSTYCLYPS